MVPIVLLLKISFLFLFLYHVYSSQYMCIHLPHLDQPHQ
ncbi:unnamed protein product [Brugia timori]|uniref:Uncharacterized protein n=1 Tax=Brugia timori TaxID=42155 RepID=A0A0R3QDQ6_9BILA|nr:unnamed protein product [Brugia timori]